MCVMSMVMDHYEQRIPTIPVTTIPNTPTGAFWYPNIDVAELRKLIDEFKAAVAAAKTIDVLTKQSDCVDPEKQKLEDRVAELERRLDAMGAAIGGVKK